MRLALLVLVVTAGVPALLAREQSASVPLRERVITRNFEIRLPPHPCAVPSTIQFLAAHVDAVSGTEFTPEPCDFRTPSPAPSDEANLLGLTVENALNLLVKIDPRYAWRESDGVIMLRPLDAWVDDKHFVHETIGPIEFENQAIGVALDVLRPVVGRKSNIYPTLAGHTPQGWQEFSVKLPAMSGLDALNGIVRAHGNMHWQLSYCRPQRSRENAKLFLFTSDRSGVGTSGKCVS